MKYNICGRPYAQFPWIHLVGDDHGVEGVPVQGVDVGATVFQVGRPGSTQRTIVAIRVLDFWRIFLPAKKD